ncbi:OmpL47-type beta-barrel domain-containing protein [Amycolatopsis suaedae]|uniref:Uncharacterized protein n=1 Tax=Amycolatopsis suaedae TaxID=2510978 RepID=A0A4Q7J4T4_9PSEU|nr:hypothetical protein [Amycolatopsis suaedae]RZQ61818.1 hypothetical protein EWH70_23010 [Amycolatopsis suaedae]
MSIRRLLVTLVVLLLAGTGSATAAGRPDTLPPRTMVTVQPSGPDGQEGWYVTAPVTVTLTAVDPGHNASGLAGTKYRIDRGPWVSYSRPFTVAGDRAHSVDFNSTDNAGNTEQARTLRVNIDASPPEVNARFDGGWHGGPVRVPLVAADRVSGVRAVEYKVDSLGWQTYYGPVLVEGDGRHTVRYRAVDRAGNVSPNGPPRS